MEKGDQDVSAKYIRATLDHVESIDAQEGRDAVQDFWERAVESKCEGLMIKVCTTRRFITRTKLLPATR